MNYKNTLSAILIAACATGALSAPTFAASRAAGAGSAKSAQKTSAKKSGEGHRPSGTRGASKQRVSHKSRKGGKAKSTPIVKTPAV